MNRKAVEVLRAAMVTRGDYDDAEYTIENLRAAGYAIVPLEPTNRMCDAGEGFNLRCGCPDCDHEAGECIAKGYRAMIAAMEDE